MTRFLDDVNYQINRILRVCVEWLGLQRTAVQVLTTFYSDRSKANKDLTIIEISRITTLSQSTVSSICSQLESLSILEKRLDGTQKTTGRRRIIFCLRLDLGDLLKLGLSKNIRRVHSILDDIHRGRLIIEGTAVENDEHVGHIINEVSKFLTEPWWN
jgi:DNA-binding transcriptional regulator GbsR (MarR family)